ncbi:hypothetical protein V6N11_051490 [Hibiscus sabdariffa]|uniref:RNase H type-1 domain-containing protein n=1 Tax=Hibiscus sabdariffa TaxID=183260 RepID=A0ABR2U784_9ROSI
MRGWLWRGAWGILGLLLKWIFEMRIICLSMFHFTCREGNVPADILARLVKQGTLEYHQYLDPPLAVRDSIDADKRCLMAN